MASIQGEKADSPRKDVSGVLIHSGSTYQLGETLGEGGMGSVYKALRTTAGGHKQTVALKVVRDKYDAASCKALIREARRISELRHDNIVSFVDSGITEDGQLFVALEYIPGLDLNQFLDLHNLNKASLLNWRRPSRVPDPITGFILLMAARALDAAHTHEFEDGKIGLVNRDVSPDNFVLERKFGFVKQIDFGVAETIDDIKAAHEGSPEEEGQFNLTGKLLYLSPEGINNLVTDARTDIYALGLVGRKLVTGFDQFDNFDPDANFMKCLYRIMSAQTEPLTPLANIVASVDKRLDEILAKMTRPKMEERYQSAAALRTDLEDYLYKEGKGPTVTSLQSYIKLMKTRADKLDDREMESIGFLGKRITGKIILHWPYELNKEAKALLKKKVNPAISEKFR